MIYEDGDGLWSPLIVLIDEYSRNRRIIMKQRKEGLTVDCEKRSSAPLRYTQIIAMVRTTASFV